MGISGNISDMSGCADEIFKIIRSANRKQFDSEGAYGSGGWPALAPSTVAYKAARNLDPRILRATGDMFRALTSDDSLSVAAPRKDGLVFGTTLPYAPYHQQGRGVPKRPPVELRETDRRDIIKVIQRFVVEGGDI